MVEDNASVPPNNAATAAEIASPVAEGLLQGGKIMSLWDHLDELRRRLIMSFYAIGGLFFIFMFTGKYLMDFLKQPLVDALPPNMPALHFTGPMDVMFVNMKVAFLASIILSCPIWLYQVWKFFEPALYPSERRYVLPFVVSSSGLFFSGILFCYYVMLPIALKFLMAMGMEVGTPIITVTDYVSLVTLLFAGFGLVFETPLVLILLAMLDIISADTLTTHRRGVVIVILIVAALLTPPDPISQIIMAIPMYLFFEISIVIIRRIKKNAPPRAPRFGLGATTPKDGA